MIAHTHTKVRRELPITVNFFHSKLNNISYKAHSNDYQFKEALKNVQKDTYIQLPNMIIRKMDILNNENYIDHKILLYNKNIISHLEFVKLLSYKCNSII